MNSHLKAHGFGALDDPTILHQLAFVIGSHEKFREMLMKVTREERANAYRALSTHLRFKAKPLESYEIEAKEIAEKQQLPLYDPVTLAVREMNPTVVSEDAKEAITGKTQEERRAAERVILAENAIAESLGQEKARGRLEVFCSKCMFGSTVYANSRADANLTLVANGWKISGKKAYCPDCVPQSKAAN
jgi:hypothetical protein